MEGTQLNVWVVWKMLWHFPALVRSGTFQRLWEQHFYYNMGNMGTGIFFQCDDPRYQHARMLHLGGNINMSEDLRIALCFGGDVMNICIK